MREQIRLDDPWHTRARGEETVDLFVPWPWSSRRVLLEPGRGELWSGAQVEGRALDRDDRADGWEAGPAIRFGAWNTVQVTGGSVNGAKMVAGEPIQITSLEASLASERSLSVRVRLSRGEMITMVFILTTPDGHQVGAQEVTVGRRTTDLTVEMPVHERLHGSYRLKATLSIQDRIVDNARQDFDV